MGGGDVGLASAVHLSSQGKQVDLFSRRHSSINKTKIVRSMGVFSPGNYPIATCYNQIQAIAATHNGKLPKNIIIGCRGQDIEAYVSILGEYLNSQHNILLICSSRFSGRVFGKLLGTKFGITEAQLPAIADVNNTPFACRGNGDDQVAIKKFKQQFRIAAQNPEMTERIVNTYQGCFANLRAVNSNLEIN